MGRTLLACLVVFLAVAVAAPAPAAAVAPNSTVLVSRPDGTAPAPRPGSGESQLPGCCASRLSADGTRVVFTSTADALLPAGVSDRNRHVFVRDVVSGTTQLVDRGDGPFGGVSNADSIAPAISSDGRYVAFTSTASNLDGVGNGQQQVFVRDLQTGDTVLVSRPPGVQSGFSAALCSSVSVEVRASDGHVLVAFVTRGFGPAGGPLLAYVRDVTAADTFLVSHVSGQPGTASAQNVSQVVMSANGSRVGFTSASPLTGGTSTDVDIFQRTTVKAETSLIEVTATNQSEEIRMTGIANSGSVAFTSSEQLVSGDTDSADDVYRATAGFGVFGVTTYSDTPGRSASAEGEADGSILLVRTDDPALIDGPAPAAGEPLAVRMAIGSSGPQQIVAREDGAEGPPVHLTNLDNVAISRSGGVVAFASDLPGLAEGDDDDFPVLALRDVAAGHTSLASRPDGPAAVLADGAGHAFTGPNAVSADGRFVAFGSGADVLLGGKRSREGQLFVRDVATGRTDLVSRSAAGEPGNDVSGDPAISADGRIIAFESSATNLLPGTDPAAARVYVHDRQTGGLTLLGLGNDPSISEDGRLVAFHSREPLTPDDQNAFADVFVADRSTGAISLVSRDAEGGGNAASRTADISGDGTRVAFESVATNLGTSPEGTEDTIYVRTLATQDVVNASRASDGAPANGRSSDPTLDRDGSIVAFTANATNLAPSGVPDALYVRDLAAGTTRMASVVDGGATGFPAEGKPVLSADGTRVAFMSDTSLAGADTNSERDAYVRDLAAGRTILASRANGADGTGAGQLEQSNRVGLSADGRCVAFPAEAQGLAPDQPLGSDFTSVFLRSLDGECAALPADPPGPGPGPGPDPGPSSPVTGPSPVTPRDTAAPVLSGAGLSRRRFRVGTAPTATAVAAQRTRAGTSVRARLSEDARVGYAVAREAPGRRLSRTRCVKPTRALRRRPRCTRLVAAGTIARDHRAGAVRLAFSGRIGRRALAPGRYRMTLVATDAAGNKSRPVTLRFTIVRR